MVMKFKEIILGNKPTYSQFAIAIYWLGGPKQLPAWRQRSPLAVRRQTNEDGGTFRGSLRDLQQVREGLRAAVVQGRV